MFVGKPGLFKDIYKQLWLISSRARELVIILLTLSLILIEKFYTQSLKPTLFPCDIIYSDKKQQTIKYFLIKYKYFSMPTSVTKNKNPQNFYINFSSILTSNLLLICWIKINISFLLSVHFWKRWEKGWIDKNKFQRRIQLNRHPQALICRNHWW